MASAQILDSLRTCWVDLHELQRGLSPCGLHSRKWAGEQGDGACHTHSPVPGTQHACLTNVRCGTLPRLGSSDNFSSFCIYICSPAASFHLSCSSPHGRSGGPFPPHMTARQRCRETGLVFLQIFASLPAGTRSPISRIPAGVSVKRLVLLRDCQQGWTLLITVQADSESALSSQLPWKTLFPLRNVSAPLKGNPIIIFFLICCEPQSS